MTISMEFVGAWRRVGLVIDGVRRVDFSDVLWLQSPSHFVDIRTLIEPGLTVPAGHIQSGFAEVFCFAGTTEFNNPKLHWKHLLDSRGEAPPDENPVVWQDKLLIERGSFEWQGREVPFVEEWGYLGGSSVNGWADDTRVRVEAAGFAIEASQTDAGFQAVKYFLSGGQWQECARVSVDG